MIFAWDHVVVDGTAQAVRESHYIMLEYKVIISVVLDGRSPVTEAVRKSHYVIIKYTVIISVVVHGGSPVAQAVRESHSENTVMWWWRLKYNIAMLCLNFNIFFFSGCSIQDLKIALL